ncbi:hypothetical protein [Cryobacterium sp. TMT4-31]|uniref:TolB family protein n=1 Tax=Cryobacterium sp. TMT4-31 TaxID=1259259 RepID=UPI00106D1144|nr:hypothetical protein [Cryobacterium sp. TMT4-31]TFC92823.1 hypothetical protein E3T19_00535 [Cryobacterium sp. TMT4-31]
MTARKRTIAAVLVSAVLLGGAGGYGIVAWAGSQERRTGGNAVQAVTTDTAATGDRIVFRNTASGDGYGLVAFVPLADPAGERSVTAQACDRVYATTVVEMCLHIDRGIVTTFAATLRGADAAELRTWPLPGIPSRTRVSANSRLVAVTAFVTGESYGTVAFSTQTTISTIDGTDYGNLEDFALLVDGERITAADRNIWGVTFGSDDTTFYATAATAGRTWLVRGDLTARTLTAIRESAECPSLSPDGRHIAYKKVVTGTASPVWSIAVLDLETGVETLLPTPGNVDDQVEWLDDSTLLYGLARTDVVGDSDVWSISIDGASQPRLFIPHAWSPSVVRS